MLLLRGASPCCQFPISVILVTAQSLNGGGFRKEVLQAYASPV